LSASTENPACHGETGSITARASGGATPYSFKWDKGPASATYNDIYAGTYSVVVTDSKGCQVSRSFELTQPAKLTASMGSQDVTIPRGSDGKAWVTPSGGVVGNDYTYSWNNGGSTSLIGGLKAGTYSVVVIDDNGCTVNGQTEVNEPACNLITNIQKTDISCNELEDGSAGVLVNLGDADTEANSSYTYFWTPGGYTSSSISGLSAGSYTVQVTDQSTGCQSSSTTEIIEPSRIAITLGITHPTNSEGDNGSISASAIGGTPPYRYDWGDNTGSSTISNLSAGSYTVTVLDSRDCSETATGIVNYCNLSVTFNVTYNPCPSEDVIITARVLGGSGRYSYIWSDGSMRTAITGTRGQNYCINIVDLEDENCTVSNCITPTRCDFSVKNENLENRTIEKNIKSNIETPIIEIYPNPFNDLLQIDIETQQGRDLEVLIVDLMGRTIYRKLVDTKVGLNKLTVDMEAANATNGLYQVLIRGKDITPQSFKVVRMK